MICCRDAGFASGMAWCALTTSTVINNADNILSDGFVGAGKFDLLGGGDLCVLDICLVREVLSDGDGAILKVNVCGKGPCIPRGQMIDAVVHSESVLDMFYTINDVSGCASEQEHMGDIRVDSGYDVVVRQRK